MKRKRMALGVAAWVLGVSGMLGAGCSTPGGSGRDANLLGQAGGTEPAFFSDDASMRQVAESQELRTLQKEEYRVGPDDVLEISIFEWEANEETKTLKLRVSETGVVSLPVVGALNVAGKSVQEIQRMIEEQLVSQNVLQTPRVGVWVSEFRSRQISVIGSVHQPGSYAIHQNVSTLLGILALAGGPREDAGAVAYVIRSGGEASAPRIQVDLAALLETGDASLNPVLSAGDVIYVPKAPLIYVYGAVKQAGAFTFRKQLRVLEAIALAGGFAELADRRGVILTRRSADGQERMHRLDVAKIEIGEAPNLYLRDGDVLHVRTSGPKTLASEVLQFIRGIFSVSYRLD